MTIIETAKQYYIGQLNAVRRQVGLVTVDGVLGYAPKEWRGLLDYLLEQGFSEDQAVDAGLCIRNGGHVYDRHRGKLLSLDGPDILPARLGDLR